MLFGMDRVFLKLLVFIGKYRYRLMFMFKLKLLCVKCKVEVILELYGFFFLVLFWCYLGNRCELNVLINNFINFECSVILMKLVVFVWILYLNGKWFRVDGFFM